ncbi:hypothetical protein KSP40_PGU003453 [Platanthera guangdongensis]|uniref:Ubiquitin-like protease family profile domain-containing protein n=1 Tax=Platanthera guangdongensis TaxID=2320717 RepID=A0ABR2LLU8_9ASPA
MLSDQSNILLSDADLLQFFSLPDLPTNIPLLHRLIRLYEPNKEAFLLKKYYVKLTVNEIAVILGLPNRGEEFSFKRAPYFAENQKHLLSEKNQLALEEPTPEVWFFEHSSMQVPVNPLGRPRIARLVSKGSFNYNFCRDLTTKLCVKDRFTEHNMEEQELLGAEDVESSFEAVGKLLHKKIIKRTREDIKKENEEIQKLKEENKKEKEMMCLMYVLLMHISSLYEDTGDAFSAATTGWNIELVDSSPKQLNSHDCGVFVIEYMEAASSSNKKNWEKCQDWQRMMPKFRAELADEMIRTFCIGSNKGLVQHKDLCNKRLGPPNCLTLSLIISK